MKKKYPEFVYAYNYCHNQSLHVVHPANQYSFKRIAETVKEFAREGHAKNVWIGEETIQWEN